MDRRLFLRSAAALAAASAWSRRSLAADAPKEIRLGFQKAGLLVAVRQRGTIEDAFKPLGIPVRWVEFQFGPPMLEALNLGSIDFATVGDAPPIFAQAAAANLYYIAAQRPSGEAIIVPPDSPITTLEDLKGKRIGIPKGSSAHATAVAAVEKAGLAWTDINPAYLSPADGSAAFKTGAIDAWSIWDPYLAIAELTNSARVIAFNTQVHNPHGFYLANKTFTDKYPETVGQIADLIAREAAWAEAHHDDMARVLQEAQGLDLAVEQATADRFLKLGLIPKPIVVRDIVWKWKPQA